jgi:hypothetical protein
VTAAFAGFAVAVAMLAGCGHGEHRTLVMTSTPAEYPGVLRDPATYAHEFMVRQTITIHAQHDGKPVDGQFDAVLEKHGDRLVILGFGPMNVKAFSIEQRGDRIEFAQFMGPALPFSPRNIVLDVHRVYFKRLPSPTDPSYSGVLTGELDGEHVEETWQDGQLRKTVFTRPSGTLPGAIRIELAAGCRAISCEPESATLHNEWFGYTLSIANETYEQL